MSGNTLQQVETFKYLRVVFTSDGSGNKEIDTRIGKANAVLREFYCSVVAKRELSKTAMLSVFKSVSGPSPGFSSRGTKKQKEGPKTRRGATFLKSCIGCMQQPGGQP